MEFKYQIIVKLLNPNNQLEFFLQANPYNSISRHIKDERRMSQLYSVQKIIGKRNGTNGKIQYLVKWQNYEESQSTWEPAKNLNYVKDIINDYQMQLNESDKQIKYNLSKSTQEEFQNKNKSKAKHTKGRTNTVGLSSIVKKQAISQRQMISKQDKAQQSYYEEQHDSLGEEFQNVGPKETMQSFMANKKKMKKNIIKNTSQKLNESKTVLTKPSKTNRQEEIDEYQTYNVKKKCKLSNQNEELKSESVPIRQNKQSNIDLQYYSNSNISDNNLMKFKNVDKKLEKEAKPINKLIENKIKFPLKKIKTAQQTIIRQDQMMKDYQKIKTNLKQLPKKTDAQVQWMSVNKNGQFQYYLKSGEISSYKSRTQMMNNYVDELISFYESKICFLDKDKK